MMDYVGADWMHMVSALYMLRCIRRLGARLLTTSSPTARLRRISEAEHSTAWQGLSAEQLYRYR